jgi:BirA family biotin operon repressor/biotin-[acetyl-CoA-carboxylase] ligase
LSGVADLARALASRPGIPIENVIVADRIDSTNTLARRLFDEAWTGSGSGPEALIAALEQTAGRGRQGRGWVSRRGLGVYATLLLAVGEKELQTLPLLVGIGLARALRELGCPARLKWPNDVQVAGRKLGGILIESISRDATGAAAIIGFGVNHGHHAAELPTPASTSLRQLLDPLPRLERVAADLVAGVLAEIAHAGDAKYARQAYEEMTVHRAGETLRCRMAEEDLEGVFLGFDERGFLRLAVNGRERRVASGEIVE